MRVGNRMSVIFLVSAFAAPALSAQAFAAQLLAAQAPTTGWRAEFLGVFGDAENKYYQLAQAMPWEKYSWRPGKGVRSVCEVFLHIGGANYEFSAPLGVKTPANVNLKTIETCPDSKDKVLATMKTSFAHMRNAVLGMSDSDGDKPADLFGQHTTKRGVLLSAAEHAGEHLGQSIAYARTNGVVPPWSK